MIIPPVAGTTTDLAERAGMAVEATVAAVEATMAVQEATEKEEVDTATVEVILVRICKNYSGTFKNCQFLRKTFIW